MHQRCLTGNVRCLVVKSYGCLLLQPEDLVGSTVHQLCLVSRELHEIQPKKTGHFISLPLLKKIFFLLGSYNLHQAEKFKNLSEGVAQVRVLSGGEKHLKSEGVGEGDLSGTRTTWREKAIACSVNNPNVLMKMTSGVGFSVIQFLAQPPEVVILS